MKLTEGRKSNILKILSQLHAYLKRYQDLDKTEIHFEQRLEDAGCTDLYAVIDDVLDIVETAKPKEKARLLNRVYKAYFPKSAEKDPATDEEVETAMGKEDGEEEGTQVEGAPQMMTLGDLRKGNTQPTGEPTLGDVRKDEEEYLGSSEDDEEEDWTLSSMEKGVKGKSAKHWDDDLQDDLDRSRGKLDDEELEESFLRESFEDDQLMDMASADDHEGTDQAYERGKFAPDYEDDEPKYTIDDLTPGMIVDCGAYGESIVVCSIHDDHRFWGTDDVEDYKENSADASGWYFDVADVEDIIGSVNDGDDDDDWEEQAERRELDSTFGTFGDHGTDDEIEETIKIAKTRAQNLREGDSGWGDATPETENYEDMGPVDDFETPERALAGTRHPVDIMDSLNDEVFEYIEELRSVDPEITDEELAAEIVKEFSDPEYPLDDGIAYDIIGDYEAENNPANEEATSGQIEDEYADLAIDGVPDATIIDRLMKKYKLTKHELEMMLGEDRDQEFAYEGPDEVDEYPLDDTEDVVIPNWDGQMTDGEDHEYDDYEAEMNEGVLSPAPIMNKMAQLAYRQFAAGRDESAVELNLRDRGLSPKQINQVLDYIAFKQPETEKPLFESLPGPSDMHAGQPTQPASSTPPTPYNTAPADLGQGTPTNTNDNTNDNTKDNQPAAAGAPPQDDKTQQLLQNPEFADFFQAMSKINPNDLQNLTQALGQK